jgi:transcriptional regulator with XRE-family HTH domain
MTRVFLHSKHDGQEETSSASTIPAEPAPERKGGQRRRRGGAPAAHRLRQVLGSYEPGLEALARRLGWPLSKLSKLKHGKQQPTLPDLVELAEALNLAVSDLLHPGQLSPHHVPIETYPLVPLELLGSLNDRGLATLRETWGGPTVTLPKTAPRAIVARYDGDGFDRYVKVGSNIVVDPDQKEPQHGQAFLLQLDDGRMLIREYRGDRAPRWVANSVQRLDDLFVDEDFQPRVIGRVIEAVVTF